MANLEAYGEDIIGGYGDLNGNLADEYNPSETYNTGDHCIYNGVYLTCNTDSTTGAFDSTKWDFNPVGEEINQIKTGLSDRLKVVTYTLPTNKTIGGANAKDLGLVSDLFDLPSGATVYGVAFKNEISDHGMLSIGIVVNKVYVKNCMPTTDEGLSAGSVISCFYLES